jgi:hypothetical protein
MSRRATREDHWSKQRELDQTAFTAITNAQAVQIKDLQERDREKETKIREMDGRLEYQQGILDKALGYITTLRDIIKREGLSAPELPRDLRIRSWARGRNNK